MLYPESLARLIEELGKLPGVGPKSAQRMAYHLLQQDPREVRRFAQALVEARERTRHCSVCFTFTEADPCGICTDPMRDRRILLVVEEPKDVIAVERTREYRGLYHVLGGSISPMAGIGPEQLRIRELVHRLDHDPVEEVVLATDPDVEGETTALYIARLLADRRLRVTRIARGLPIGGDLDYADELTLVRALEGRKEF
jgi:recombination protein RecR